MNNEILKRVKTVLGIQDSLQDAQLLMLIEEITSEVLLKLNKKGYHTTHVPQELWFIITSLVRISFNKIGAEGISTDKQMDFVREFSQVELKRYDTLIEDFANPPIMQAWY